MRHTHTLDEHDREFWEGVLETGHGMARHVEAGQRAMAAAIVVFALSIVAVAIIQKIGGRDG